MLSHFHFTLKRIRIYISDNVLNLIELNEIDIMLNNNARPTNDKHEFRDLSTLVVLFINY